MKEIEVVNICDLLEILFPGYWEAGKYKDHTWDVTSKAVIKWCEDNDAHYYGAPRESFSIYTGIREAEAAGKSKVVVEDMS
jgi:hypothetical protein